MMPPFRPPDVGKPCSTRRSLPTGTRTTNRVRTPSSRSPAPVLAPMPAQAPPVQPVAASVQLAPPPDPTPGYQQAWADVNADYAYEIKQYRDALYRLHDLNGAGMMEDDLSLTFTGRDIQIAARRCSPLDQPRAEALAQDLYQKWTDIEAAGKSSPTGGGYVTYRNSDNPDAPP